MQSGLLPRLQPTQPRLVRVNSRDTCITRAFSGGHSKKLVEAEVVELVEKASALLKTVAAGGGFATKGDITEFNTQMGSLKSDVLWIMGISVTLIGILVAIK